MPTEARPALAFYLGRATFCPLLGQFYALGKQKYLARQADFHKPVARRQEDNNEKFK